MSAFPSYATGTVSVAAGGTVIVGAGTIWSDVNARAGDDIVIAGHTVIVEDVTDPTHLVIDAWPYADVPPGTAYKIVQRSPLRYAGGQAMADVSALVAALNTDGFYVFVGPALSAPDPSLGNDRQFAFQASSGKLWQKVGGSWVFVGVFKGWGTPAPWDHAKAYSAFATVTLNGSSYLALVENTAVSPESDPGTWQLIAAKGLDGAVYTASSVTSIAIGAGAKSFTIATGRGYTVGQRLRAASAADPTNYMEGLVASYIGANLVINVDRIGGAGAHADWNINVSGDTGSQGPQGAPGSTYSGTSTSSVAIGTGAKTFAVQTGLAYLPGARVRLSSGSAYVEGVVTSYISGTGALVINADKAFGSGTFTNWTVNVAGDPGSPLGSAQQFRFVLTSATATVSGPDSNSSILAYTPGAFQAFVNGLKIPTSQITATDGVSMTFGQPLNVDDVVEIWAFAAFNPADAIAKSANGGDITDKPMFLSNIGGLGRGGLAALLRYYIDGLVLSTAGNSGTFAVTPGVATDNSLADVLSLTGAISKTGAAWSPGNGGGALDQGSAAAASTWHYVYLIKNPTSGAVDVLLSASSTSQVLPPGYTLKRRIGCLKTDGSSNWKAFLQIGETFYWLGASGDINIGSLGTASSLLTLNVPPGIAVRPLARVLAPSGQNVQILVTSPLEADEAPGSSYAVAPGFDEVGITSQIVQIAGQFYTNGASQLRFRASQAGTSLAVFTRGWIDDRGKNG